MIRVLHIVPSLARTSGISTFVYNAFRYRDDQISFDFLHQDCDECNHLIHIDTYDSELSIEGARVYGVINPRIDLRSFLRGLQDFFVKRGHRYDIVHCHVANAAFCALRRAKDAGIGVRILHSHLNTSSDHLFRRIRNRPLIEEGKRYATTFLSCSREAGEYLFGGASFEIINNGISVSDFAFSPAARAEIRGSLGIGIEAPVIGCIGRIVRQKNFSFAIDVFSALLECVPTAVLLIVGDGEEATKLKAKVKRCGLQEKVLFLGERRDMPAIYSAIDAFLMPSLCEGLPYSAIEAQASGLPCIYSSYVPRETDVTGTGVFLSFDEGAAAWAKRLQTAYSDGRFSENGVLLANSGYSAEASARRLSSLYRHLAYG